MRVYTYVHFQYDEDTDTVVFTDSGDFYCMFDDFRDDFGIDDQYVREVAILKIRDKS